MKNMITKNEFLHTKKKLKDIENLLFGMASRPDIELQEFLNLPVDTQKKIWGEWEQYYSAIKNTPVYKVLRDMSESLSIGEGVAVDGISDEWKRKGREAVALSHVPKPTHADPMSLYNRAQPYTSIVNMAHELKGVVEEYETVFDTSRVGGM